MVYQHFYKCRTLTNKLILAGYGVVSPGANPLPRRVFEESRTPQIAGSKTVKIRYGPYKVPNAGVKNIVGESGVLYNHPHINVERPCIGNCVLLGISAGLEVDPIHSVMVHRL